MNEWERIMLFICILIKAFFRATIDIVWGIAGILLLAILITQQVPDAQAIYNLQDTARFIYETWALFWLAIFTLFVYSNLWRVKKS